MEFNLADLFECVADHVSDRPALVCGETRLDYRELDDRANRLARALIGLGADAGSHVGLYLRTGVEHVEAMIACYKIRAVPVNVNPRYVADELAYLCDDAGLCGLIHDTGLGPVVSAVADRPGSATFWAVAVGGDQTDGDGAYERLLASASPTRLDISRSADDHYVLYTGGTTGRPKGVVWRQEDIFFATMGGGNPGGPPISDPAAIGPNATTNRAQRIAPFLSAGDPGPAAFVSMALGPMTHASGQWSALGTLFGGGTVVLYPKRHMDMTVVLELVEHERVVALNLVGDTSARPLLAELQARRGVVRTDSLLLLGSGGSVFSAEVKRALLDELPSVLAIVDGIGSSEVPAQAVEVTTRDGVAPRSLRFAAKETTMVVDEDLHPVAPGSGIGGRLATRGRLPLGYHNDPERTAETFVDIDGERWTLPGDMARVEADGNIHLLGRGSLCINTGGEKVYPEEVEAVLKAHPGIVDAIVVGAPDERWGEHVAAVIAPVVPEAPPQLEELRTFGRAHLAAYKLPLAVHVVDVVRRSPEGKADYRWARQIAARQAEPPVE